MEFAYAGGGLGKGGKVTLFVDGKEVGDGELGRRSRCSSRPTRRPTSAPTPAPRSATTTRSGDSNFNGKIEWVQIDVDENAEDPDHLIIAGGAAADRDGPPVRARPPESFFS